MEIIVKKGGRCRYTTIQNWSNNVYNLVTKRATCEAGATMEWVDGNIGSKVTMKYPAIYLMGEHAKGETLSVAFAGEGQHQDAGAKMVHAAPHTSSSILSKSVARGGGRTSYRGLIQINEGAHGSKSNVLCDALLVDQISRSDTYPYVDIREDDVSMGHEASVSKVSDDQLFYLMSRGMEQDEAMAMIVRGFIEPIAKELPMEYALELNRLIELQMEGAVGLMGLEVSSHLHPVGSFDLSDHPVPTGREEVWRFTPLKRLRGPPRRRVRSPARTSTSSSRCPQGVTRRARRRSPTSERGLSGFVPTDRVAARVWDAALAACSPSTCPPRPRSPSRSGSTVTGRGAERGHRPPAAGQGRRPRPGHRRRRLRGLGHLGRRRRDRGRRRRPAHLRHHPGLGRRRRAPLDPARQGRPGRLAQARRGHLRRRRRAPRRHGDVRRPGRLRSRCSASTSPTPASTSSTGSSSTTTSPGPRATSSTRARCRAQGAHTVWIGNVLIRKEAEGIETYEENRNLVLTDGCQADSVPNLEIETGEIEGAGHASATARFDDEQLFYLRSRGVSEKEARRLVVHGFFNDLIRKIGVPEIEESLTTTVEAELAKNVLKDLS